MSLEGRWEHLGIRHVALAAALLSAATTAPSIANSFAGDDRWVVVERPLLRAPPSLRAVATEPYWPAGFGGVMWRPAVLASYALDYRVSSDPRWFHVTNVLWAVAAAAALAVLAALVAGRAAGLVAGLLFAVHPVHVEATAALAGRAELMAATGYATALLCAIRAEDARRYLWGVVAASALAITSKEHAATLPAAVLVVAAGRALAAGADWRASIRRALPAAAAGAVPIALYVPLRAEILPGTLAAGGITPGLEGLGLLERAWAMLPLSLEWWRLLLFPAHLSADYAPAELVPTTGFTLGHVLAAGVWAGAGWLAWRLRRRVPAVALGLVWSGVTLLPVSNLLVPTEFLVAERTLFLPSWGVAVALGGLWAAWRAPAAARNGVLAAVLAAGALRSVIRTPVWRDDDRLFQSVVRDAPRSYRTLWNQGRDEFAAGRMGS
ncbi:MAG: hypothetical protein ACREL9_09525, partial [Gemmatimonadales bacterium]